MPRICLSIAALLAALPTASPAEPTPSSEQFEPERMIRESFDPVTPSRFSTPIPNKNTEVRGGALWTRGKSGKKYPPMVYMPVRGTDMMIRFRYRHLSDGGWLWFFVDADDGFGGIDHCFRLRLNRQSIKIQVDGHTLDGEASGVRKNRPPDPVSGAYRIPERLPAENVDLTSNTWRTIQLDFAGENLTVSVDGDLWQTSLARPGFGTPKKRVLWMQNGGEAGIEIDDIIVSPTEISPSPKKEPSVGRHTPFVP